MTLWVDEWDKAGKTVIGYIQLNFTIAGYGNPDNKALYHSATKPTGMCVKTVKSNAHEDMELLEIWENMKNVPWGGYTPVTNCWTISLFWLNYGIPTKPAGNTPRCLHGTKVFCCGNAWCCVQMAHAQSN